MYLERPLCDTISMAVLLLSLAVFSVIGNGFVLGIVARLKKLRNYANILIANLALVDLLNALINMPMYLLYGVLEMSWFKGKTLAILSTFLYGLFLLLNITSMLVLLVNVFLALTVDLRYFVWKTEEKAISIVVAQWLACLVAISLSSLPLFDINLQNTHVVIYRQVYLTKTRPFFLPIFCLFIVSALVLGVLIVCSVRRKKLQVSLVYTNGK